MQLSEIYSKMEKQSPTALQCFCLYLLSDIAVKVLSVGAISGRAVSNRLGGTGRYSDYNRFKVDNTTVVHNIGETIKGAQNIFITHINTAELFR